MDKQWWVIVNESTDDRGAHVVEHVGPGRPECSGWERHWSCHDTPEEAQAEKQKAREYLFGK